MPSTAATPRPPPQTTSNFRDGGVRTGAGQSIGESSRCLKPFFVLLLSFFVFVVLKLLQCTIRHRKSCSNDFKEKVVVSLVTR